MPTELIMCSIFIILMGYFTNPFNIKMYLLSFLGLETGMIIKLIVSTNSQIHGICSIINEPTWLVVSGVIYFIMLFMIGRFLASTDVK